MLEKEKRDRELKKYNDKKKREWEETIREKIRKNVNIITKKDKHNNIIIED